MVENLEKITNQKLEKYQEIEKQYLELTENIEQKDIIFQKLTQLTKQIIAQEKEENPSLLIDSDTGRLDINEYHKHYANEKYYSPKIKEEIEEILKKYKEEWYENLIENKSDLKHYVEKHIKGEKAELFILANLYKFLGDNFIIVRSSYYDDIDNGVDTIVFDKKSGNIICAFDETSAFSPHFEEKKKKILKKNINGGVRLKYGLKLERTNNSTDIKGAPVQNIPIFYLPIEMEEVERELLNKIDSLDLNIVSEIDELIFVYLMQMINRQVKDFTGLSELKDFNIPLDIIEKEKDFIEKIVKIYPNIFYEESQGVSIQKGKLSLKFYTNKNKIPPKEIDKYRIRS